MPDMIPVVHAVTDPRRRYEALFDELYEPLQRYAARRTDPETARDVVAETLTIVWRRLDDVPAGGALPWAYRVAANCLANARRSERRREGLHRRIATIDPPTHTVADDTADPAVLAAIAQLGDVDREVIRLWAWEGLSPAEIALVLDTTPNAVSIRLHRAKARLADLLRKTECAAGQEADNRREAR